MNKCKKIKIDKTICFWGCIHRCADYGRAYNDVVVTSYAEGRRGGRALPASVRGRVLSLLIFTTIQP